MISKVCAELGLRPVSVPRYHPVGVFFQDRTRTDYVAPRDGLLNQACTDISKQHIEQVFERVFGYPLAIDPLTYQGPAVCKSDENGTHDGCIVECPIQKRELGVVYEVLIDNSISEAAVQDVRVVVVGNDIPIAYLKSNWKEKRFANWTFEVKLANASDVLTSEEQALVIEFARAIGLDFGELDTLRDRKTGRIYIVDAAKTAFGPPGRLGFLSKIRAVKTVAHAFKEEFL